MRNLRIAAVFVAILGAVGCSQTVPNAIPATQAVSTNAEKFSLSRDAAERYIYVADGKQKTVIVYPAHVDNPAPVRTISESSGPIGVAVSPAGSVFVSFPNENAVRVYASGGSPLLQTMTSASGLYYPTGMTFDAQGNLWIANRGNPSYVNEYAPGSQTPSNTVDLPNHFVPAGIAFDHGGNLWVDMMASQGGFVVEYPHGNSGYTTIIGTGGNGGVAVDARGFLQVATLADVFTFAPPSPKRVAMHFYGEGSELRQLTASPNGALYVPIGSTTGHPEVVEIPANSARAPLHITQGLEDPWGAAAGP